MGYGTTWRVGHESEARLLWDCAFPDDRLVIEVKFVTSLELQMLRCRLHGLTEFDPKVEVYELAFPKESDPEWEAWYPNIAEEAHRVIEAVRPDFLAELCAIAPGEVEVIGADWGAMTEGWWHREWPHHAPWAVGEFVRVASAARDAGMGVLAKHFG